MTEREAASQACVLVVDDDAQVRQVIQWALEDEGFLVLGAANGREAMALVAGGAPDLVVLDLTLPEMNGLEVAERVRALERRPVPILLITADGQAPAKAERVGAYTFLRKPFQIEDLLNAVRTGLRSLADG